MKKISVALCSLWAWCSAVFAEVPQDYRYNIPLTVQNTEGLHRLEIPLAVYSGAARADLRDVRLFNAQGERMPFALANTAKSETEKKSFVELPIFPVYRTESARHSPSELQVTLRKDGTLLSLSSTSNAKRPQSPIVENYLLDGSKLQAPFSALVLDWASSAAVDKVEKAEKTEKAEIKRVDVDISDDFKSWQRVVSNAPLFDLEFGGEKLVQKRIEFPATRAKYVRLSWGSPALELKSVQAEMVTSETPPPFKQFTVSATRGAKAGEYNFDLDARVPIEQMQLVLPQPNTVAPTVLFSRPTEHAEWRLVTTATFYRLMRDGLEVVAPSTKVGGRNDRYWMMRVDQKGGGLGEGLPQLMVEWAPRQIVFVTRGTGPYWLAYGKHDAERVDFPLSHLIPGHQTNAEFKLPVAQAGEPIKGKGTDDNALLSLPVFGEVDRKPVFLWAILVIGVALIGWMAWRLGTQIKTSGTDHKNE